MKRPDYLDSWRQSGLIDSRSRACDRAQKDREAAERAMPQMIADVTAERDRLRFPAFILRVLEYALVLTVLTAAALATLYLA